MSRGREILLLAFLSTVWIPGSSFAQPSEYVLKAVHLGTISSYVTWPEESVSAGRSPSFVIAVFGENPFGPILDQTYAERTILDKEVTIRYISRVDDIAGSHLLFISAQEGNRLAEILAFTKDKPILTVSDGRGFAEEGVLINIYPFGKNKFRFEMNESEFLASTFSMDYRLRKYTRIVNPISGFKR